MVKPLDLPNSTRMPLTCPCARKYEMDRVTNVDGPDKPAPGSFALCGGCGTVLRFMDNMQLRETWPGEPDKELSAADLLRLQEAAELIRMFRHGAPG